MPPLSMQSLRAVKPRKYGFSSTCVSRRALSSSRVCLEEVRPASEHESIPQKGVPLAFELGGITIDKPGQRPTLMQKLAARRAEAVEPKNTTGTAETPPESRGQSEASQVISPRILQARESQAASASGARRVQAKHGGQGRPVPPSHKPRASSQNTERNPEANRQRPPTQARQRPGGSRPMSQRQGQTDRPSRSEGVRARTPRRDAPNSALQNRNTNPDSNDYPNENRNKPPVRKFDKQGLLKLKGQHEQINPVACPILPRFTTLSMNTPRSLKTTSVMSTLQVLSYSDRAPPKRATEPRRGARSVVDNASLALSRVRDLNMPRRRDALGIVQKMAKGIVESDKEVTANT